ncbi:hypothetical protein BWGOE4_57030 [Bacillus mycoides]|uniref:Uncharacterized protein n=2 Tax=Bacillus TaxID=1386 RepID=A0A1E8BT52_BACMY|nr:hypothetical protein [Bacillus cereus]OFD35919.1 hypothetical protein BWGOE3_57630 [Bacillus mycoides]OFD51946.1 hypothetical protein BWGOE4_57030 [Bacillus mycoides]OFD57571.1 hypothetical protein BWGOE7_55400 [Bacillus mycoides]OFD87911.1 hypothetical protein BWGOE12_55700 [Bacillus mycoides]
MFIEPRFVLFHYLIKGVYMKAKGRTKKRIRKKKPVFQKKKVNKIYDLNTTVQRIMWCSARILYYVASLSLIVWLYVVGIFEGMWGGSILFLFLQLLDIYIFFALWPRKEYNLAPIKKRRET